MTTIQAQVPEPLARQIAELARQENVSVDQLVSIMENLVVTVEE